MPATVRHEVPLDLAEGRVSRAEQHWQASQLKSLAAFGSIALVLLRQRTASCILWYSAGSVQTLGKWEKEEIAETLSAPPSKDIGILSKMHASVRFEPRERR